MDSIVSPRLARVLKRQCGVFTRKQAIDAGLTDEAVEAQVAARRWTRAAHGIYTAFTGPPHQLHREWIAVLAAGGRAALSHETAAHHHGLLHAAPARIHVLAPHDTTPVHLPGVRLHRTRSTRTIVGSPPVTSVADTLCDLTASGWRGDELAGVVTKAFRERLTDLDSMALAWGRRGRFRGLARLKELAADAGLGSHSSLEMRWLRDLERAHGLPIAERQSRVAREGRTTYRDLHYPAFALTIELDGRTHHGSFDARLRDMRRDRIAGRAGELTLRYGWTDTAAHSCATAIEVAVVLRDRGWTGQMTRCPNCP